MGVWGQLNIYNNCLVASVPVKEIMRYHNEDEYTESELEDYFDTIKEYSVKKRINELKREMNETLDVNKKIELANKINKINKEVLQW